MKHKFLVTILCCLFISLHTQADPTLPARQMEALNRGLVAVKSGNNTYLSWRLLGTDADTTYFKIYKNNALVKTTTAAEATNYTSTGYAVSDKFKVEAYAGTQLLDSSKSISPWAQQYLAVQLDRPAGGTTPPNVTHPGTANGTATNYPNGESYTYTPNDCSVGDVDGDGEYEIIVKWDPSNSKDNSQTGITGNVYLDAYKLDGTRLWRVDLGRNIRAGAHYTQFLVYDFDGDGKAEVVCRTAPGTVDGLGHNVLLGSDSPTADYRNLALNTSGNSRCGFVLSGPEYLTLFDGETGENIHSVPFSPARGSVSGWGDSYGNRVDRFLACVAYLDGVHPSAVMCRGYYNKACLTAYDVVNKQLVQRWAYDSGASASVNGGSIAGMGNHNLSVADVDGDGKDEIIYGASAIDDNGKRLYSTGLGHGDAMHMSDLDPDRPGLEVWEVHEETGSGKWNHELHDARTGEILWHSDAYGSDNGRGMSGDIDASHRGFEMWSSAESGTYDCKGVKISNSKPSQNFRIYWDGDLQDELLDGSSNAKVTKWNGNGVSTLITFSGTNGVNGTKANPNLSGDILGDWREEAIYYVAPNASATTVELRIYTTITPTTNRLYTLMHDPVYRLGIAWQNAAYNQPPHLGFYMGDGLDNVPVPNIYTDSTKAVYFINYTLNGGINHVDNPTFYTMSSPIIILQEPTKAGYDFDGWAEGNTIITGSKGNKTFTAQWKLIDGVADVMQEDIRVYPNPASDNITIVGVQDGERITITDLSGRTLLSVEATLSLPQIDISSLATGVYLVHVGNRTAKIIK